MVSVLDTAAVAAHETAQPKMIKNENISKIYR